MMLIGSATQADEIRGITVGDHFSALAEKFTEGKILTVDDPIGKDYGFKLHTIEAENVMLEARSFPTGELYQIGFAQLIPLKQADEFKDGLCEKYAISPCEWDMTSLKTITGKPVPQFLGKREAGDTTVFVSLSNSRRSDQKGFLWAGANINRGESKELVERWKIDLRIAEQNAKEAAALEASQKAAPVEMNF